MRLDTGKAFVCLDGDDVLSGLASAGLSIRLKWPGCCESRLGLCSEFFPVQAVDRDVLMNPDPLAIVLFILGALAIFFAYRKYTHVKVLIAETAQARRSLELEAEKLRAEALVDAEKQRARMLAESEALMERKEGELREHKAEIKQLEGRVLHKEELLERKATTLDERDVQLREQSVHLEKVSEELEQRRKELTRELERIGGLSAEAARIQLLKSLEDELRQEMGRMIRDAESQAREQADKKARDIITTAIQRCAVDHTVDATVTVVALPNDEMKGRIIGREGRNIRALEAATGIDLIIDDTPEAVILSSFDPVRREVARITLEKLIADGRIHPTRIDEVVEKAREEVEKQIREDGENACLEAQVPGVHPELVKVLGRLRYRTSYGQNVLSHSVEVAHICAAIAAELGADIALARRAGLLHDIGKALSHEVEGPHALVGGDLCRRYGESPKTVNAIAAHHLDVPQESVEAVLVQVADAISASRPGARRDTIDIYIKRLEKLEQIARSFNGVERSYAVQAGREIRIVVQPSVVDDQESAKLARDVARKIESELEYPGQIKVTVVRETRATEYAK